MQVILGKVMNSDIIVMRLGAADQFLDRILIVYRMGLPFIEVGCFVFITQVREGRVGVEPLAVQFKEIDIARNIPEGILLALVQLPDRSGLDTGHFFIIHLG